MALTVSGDTYRAGLLQRQAVSAAASANRGCMRSRALAPLWEGPAIGRSMPASLRCREMSRDSAASCASWRSPMRFTAGGAGGRQAGSSAEVGEKQGRAGQHPLQHRSTALHGGQSASAGTAASRPPSPPPTTHLLRAAHRWPVPAARPLRGGSGGDTAASASASSRESQGHPAGARRLRERARGGHRREQQ